MAGGTVEHGRLIGRATALIDRALEGKPCIVLPSDLAGQAPASSSPRT